VWPTLLFSLCLDMLVHCHIPFIWRKMEKYLLSEKMVKFYVEPLIMRQEGSFMENESLKLLYYYLEQPK
jgi:hypothetical protein